MHSVLCHELNQGRLRSARQNDHCRNFTIPQSPYGLVIVVIRTLDIYVKHPENDVRRNLRLTVLQIEVDPLAAQIFVAFDVVARDNVKLRIIELGDILNALFNIRIKPRIPFLQELKVILINDAHIDTLEEQHVIQILQAADTENRQNAQAVRPQIIDDIADV